MKYQSEAAVATPEQGNQICIVAIIPHGKRAAE